MGRESGHRDPLTHFWWDEYLSEEVAPEKQLWISVINLALFDWLNPGREQKKHGNQSISNERNVTEQFFRNHCRYLERICWMVADDGDELLKQLQDLAFDTDKARREAAHRRLYRLHTIRSMPPQTKGAR